MTTVTPSGRSVTSMRQRLTGRAVPRRVSSRVPTSCAPRSIEVIAASMALAKRLKKVGVLVGNCRGFVGNRMYAQYQREAQLLVEEAGDQIDYMSIHWYVGDKAGDSAGYLATSELIASGS